MTFLVGTDSLASFNLTSSPSLSSTSTTISTSSVVSTSSLSSSTSSLLMNSNVSSTTSSDTALPSLQSTASQSSTPSITSQIPSTISSIASSSMTSSSIPVVSPTSTTTTSIARPSILFPSFTSSSFRSTTSSVFTLPAFFTSNYSNSSTSSTISTSSSSSSSTSSSSVTSSDIPSSATPVQYTITTSGKVVIITLTTSEIVTDNSSATTGSKALNGDTTGYQTFFDNTAAVAGTFTVVALLIIGILVGMGYLFFRRRKTSRLRQAEREAVGGAGDGGAGQNRFAGEEEDVDPFHASQGSHDDQSVYFQRGMTSYNTSPVYFPGGGDSHRRSLSSPLNYQQPSSYQYNGFSPQLDRPKSQELEGSSSDWAHYRSGSIGRGTVGGMEVVEEPGEQHQSVEGHRTSHQSIGTRYSVASQYSESFHGNQLPLSSVEMTADNRVDERLEPIGRVLRLANPED